MTQRKWQWMIGGLLWCAVLVLAGAPVAQAAPPPPKFPWMKQSSQQAQPSQSGGQQAGQPQFQSSSPSQPGGAAKATAAPSSTQGGQATGGHAGGRTGGAHDTGPDTKGLGQKLKEALGGVYDKTQQAASAGSAGQQPGQQQVGTLQSVCDFYKLALKKHFGKTDDDFVNLLLGHSYLIAADMTLQNKIDWLSAGTLEEKCKLLDAVYGYEGKVDYKATGEISGEVTNKKSVYQTIEKGLGTSLNPLEVGEYLAVTAFAEEAYKCQNMADFGDKCLLNLDALKQMDAQVDPELLLGAQKPQKGGAPSAGGEGCYYKDQNMANPFGFCSAGNVSEDVPTDEKMGNPQGELASVGDEMVVGGKPTGGAGDTKCGGVVDCEEGESDPPGAAFFMLPGMSQICGINEMAMGGGLTAEGAKPPEKTPEQKAAEAKAAAEKAAADAAAAKAAADKAAKAAEASHEKEAKESTGKKGHADAVITPEDKKAAELKEAAEKAAAAAQTAADAAAVAAASVPAVPANPGADPGCIPCAGVPPTDPHVQETPYQTGADATYVVEGTAPNGGTYIDGLPLYLGDDGILRTNDAGAAKYEKMKENAQKYGKQGGSGGGGGGGSSGYSVDTESNAGPCDQFMQKVQQGLGLICAALNKEAPIVKSNEDGTPVGFVGTEFYKGNKGELCNGLIIGKAPVESIDGISPGMTSCCDVSKAGVIWKTDPALGVTDPTPQDQTTMGSAGEPGAPAAAGTSSATPDGGAAQDDGASQQQLPADQGGQGEPGAEGPPPGDPGNPGTP